MKDVERSKAFGALAKRRKHYGSFKGALTLGRVKLSDFIVEALPRDQARSFVDQYVAKRPEIVCKLKSKLQRKEDVLDEIKDLTHFLAEHGFDLAKYDPIRVFWILIFDLRKELGLDCS